MKDSLRKKIENLLDRHDELSALLSDAQTISDQNLFRSYSQEFSELEPIVTCFKHLEEKDTELEEARALKNDADDEIRSMAQEEEQTLLADLDTLDIELRKLLIPPDPNDSSNIYLEIRAGTGGDCPQNIARASEGYLFGNFRAGLPLLITIAM